MKQIIKKVMAITGALLMGATILAGIPGYTAKAYEVNRPNRVVYEGDILENAGIVYYIKPGMSEKFIEAVNDKDGNADSGQAVVVSCMLHEDPLKDSWQTWGTIDYSVPAPEKGSTCWIVRIMEKLGTSDDWFYRYCLEPYTVPTESGSSDDAAPVYTAPVYVEPAWLTAWKGLLTGVDKQIADAKAGDTVILDLGEYHNISNARMQQIAEKNDVTFVLNITYDKVSYSLTIEPGMEIDLSCDWYGPLKLLSMFPYEVVK